MKVVVIVDMQNDFITGSLGSHAAQLAKENILKELKKKKYKGSAVIFTKDTHKDNYLDTFEGKRLPVPHCIEGTNGWCIDKDIASAVMCSDFISVNDDFYGIENSRVYKPTFGSLLLNGWIGWLNSENSIEEITFMGVCTDICVVSNVLLARAHCPNIPINVVADCCAGTTPENHDAALSVMKSCQIDII